MALYRHRLSGVFPGEEWSFNIHSESTLSLAAAQSQFVSGVNDFWTLFAPHVCDDISATLATTVEIDPATGKQLSGADTVLALAGTNATACLPFQCSVVVSLRTNLRTRAGRGRFYLPSVAVDQQAGGTLTAAAQTAIADAGAALLNGIEAAGGSVVIYHRTTHTTTDVVEARVGSIIDTQRRRRNQLVETYETRPL